LAVPPHERGLPACDDDDRAVAVPLDLEEPAVALRHVLRERGEHRRVSLRRARLVRLGPAFSLLALADEEPVLRIARELRRHECPGAVEALAVQAYRQATVALLLDELIGAAIPDPDGAGPVVPRRDLAFEVRVVERMILDVDGEMLCARLERHALRHRSARESPVALQPEVVVEPPRIVALDDEDGLGAMR